MGTTAKGLWYPDGTTTVNPMHTVLANMQNSTDSAMNRASVNTPAGLHRVSNAAGLTTLLNTLSAEGYVASTANPVYAYRADTGLLYRNTGSTWSEVIPNAGSFPNVRYDSAQSLTTGQQTQARNNISAASQADLTALNNSLTPTGKNSFSSGSWTGWWRTSGEMALELYIAYSGSIAAGATQAGLTNTTMNIPTAWLPSSLMLIPTIGPTSLPALGRITTAGLVEIRNLHTAAASGYNGRVMWFKG